jgi:GNAT superfamily N-acetyltransferase
MIFVRVAQDDPLAAPLLAELAAEYSQRYGGTRDAHHDALRNHPGAEFAPPDGAMILGLLDGAAVTGGAFRRFDDQTAELKRIRTDSRHRRRGYGSALLAELEREIAARGYRRVYLMTGDRQPEAEALYTGAGYTRLDEPLPAAGPIYPIAFEKPLA